ncbi:ammonium transporter 2 [Nicotiana attenuata]|uniref:Ammonium transporter 2 n=1 Tax=Nicotiana attenuata TaxID=49451 RepID=A0A314KWJ9_NICAT|nr:ammonium transporter 2 [Nicotiana attenuata]
MSLLAPPPPFPPAFNFSMLPSNLNPNDANPPWMSKGDNAWQLIAATLVGMQSVPGLIILYGGAVKKKWAVNSAFMALYAFACVLVCWVCWGYRLSFGEKLIPIWGKVDVALEQEYLFEQAFLGLFPNATMGIIDYSGGYVIHLSSGVAGFTAAYWVGPRSTKDRERFPPNNILLMLAGAGLLWMGWTGFNGGDPYAASIDASLAVLNTHVAAATSLLTWLILDLIFFGKPSVIGAVQGMITGLVAITPAAGVVQGWAAIIIGLCSGSIPWFTMMVVHKKSELLQKVDDTMAVFHTHAVAGSLGGILTGLFANPRLCYLFYGYYNKYYGFFYGLRDGKIHNGFRQMGLQLLGILFIVVVNVVMTSLICLLVQLIVPLRMSEEDMEIGDEAAHGEEAYAIWGQGDRLEKSAGFSAYNDDMITAGASRSNYNTSKSQVEMV